MLPIYWEKEDIRRIALTFGIIFLCIAAIAVAIWGKRGFAIPTHKVDYQMHGVYVDSDGNPGGSVDFSIKGRVLTNIRKNNFLQIEFLMPMSFPYSLLGATIHPEGFENCFYDHGGDYFSYWVTATYGYNKFENSIDFLGFALCPEQEFFILHCYDEPDKYLVASTDPNTTVQEILTYFDDYIRSQIPNS